MIAPGDYRSLITTLESRGWRVKETSNGHFQATPPDPKAQIVVFSKMKGDRAAWKNALETLRKSGFREEEHEPIGNGNRTRSIELIQCPTCTVQTFSTATGRCVRATCPSNVPLDTGLPVPIVPPHHVREAPIPRPDLDPEFTRLFEALHDARALHALAVEELHRAAEEHERAAERVRECERARNGTAADLVEAKKRFDAACEP